MKYLSTLRMRLAKKAERSKLALIDRTLSLMTLSIPSNRLKFYLGILHVLTKVLMWIAAWDEVKSSSNEDENQDHEPP